jgi:hypothetical protein
MKETVRQALENKSAYYYSAVKYIAVEENEG